MRGRRERVDHRHARRRRKALQAGVLVRADDDRVDVAREHARGVLRRLARADRKLGALREERRRPQLRERDFEGDPRPQARLFEEQRDGAALEERALFAHRPFL